MPISVVVRRESGETVASLDEMTRHLPEADRLSETAGTAPFPLVSQDEAATYPMLSSVDPYGLTCFNRGQVPRLIQELERLQAVDPDDDRHTLLSGLRILVAEHMRQPHRLLWFIGD